MNDSGGIVPVYEYQRCVIEDQARLVGWVKSRQIGGSFTCTLKVVLHALDTGQDWNMMSRSQRQAEKLLKKAATHARAANHYACKILRQPPIVNADDIGSQRIIFKNGATIEALPCDPDTTTGDTCNWLIDEFALFPKSGDVFSVIKPSIMHGKRMIVVSSPRGRRNKFFDLYERHTLGDSGWSFHKTTIEDAINDGFCPTDENGNQMTLEQFKKQEVKDVGMDMWLQEYMCSFSDRLTSFLPHELIVDCVSDRLKMRMTTESLKSLNKDLYVGIDIGRRRDFTVIWVISKSGDVCTTEAVHVLDRTPFLEQDRVIRTVMDSKQVVCCMIDESGNGMQLAETLSVDYPGVVQGFKFTNASKAEIAGRLKAHMESECFWIPKSDDVIEDFASIERNVTDAGNIQIAAPRSGSGGHGDMFWAASMAVHAAATRKPFKLVMAA